MAVNNPKPLTPYSRPEMPSNGKSAPRHTPESNGQPTHSPGRGSLKSELLKSQAEPAGEIEDNEMLSPAELAEIWARRAYALAEEPPAPATGQTVDLLVFWLGGERYGLEVTSVREIYPLEQLTHVPRTPKFVAGVFSARGRILSVIDLRAFMGLPAVGLSDQTKIIVVNNTDPTSETAALEVGLLADEVADVITIFKADIEPSLGSYTGQRADYIQGVTADMLVVLSSSALLSDKRLIVHEELL